MRSAIARCLAAGLFTGLAQAAIPPPDGERAPVIRRELAVPYEQLDLLLRDGTRRVMLTRAEFDALRRQADHRAADQPPHAVLLVGADYRIQVETDRAVIVGDLTVDGVSDGLHELPLNFGGLGVQSLMVGAQSVPLGHADDGRLLALVRGVGRRSLRLRAVTPLQTTAARQLLNFRVPQPPSTRITLEIPGDVELRSGAAVVSRVFDGTATRFELLPTSGDLALVMTLNSHLKRSERVVMARSVIVSELTQAYERQHVTVSLDVLHRAVADFRFRVPAGFEITDVTGPLLARWAIEGEGAQRILSVQLREDVTGKVVLNISAMRTGRLGDWSLNPLEPLDTVGHVAVVGVLLDERLQPGDVVTENLIPLDRSVVTQALPSSLLNAGESEARLRPLVAYYAPQAAFSLQATFTRPLAKLFVTTNVLLMLLDEGLEARGGFVVAPHAEDLFTLTFTVPRDWQVEQVSDENGNPLAFDVYPPDDANRSTDDVARVRVRLPTPVPVGSERGLSFRARHVPADWLDDWQTRTARFPVFAVTDAARDIGAIAVDARDDMEARVTGLDQLVPLDENEKNQYGLAGVATSLAFRYESRPYALALAIERMQPRLTAETYSFFTVDRGVVNAHYEVLYTVEQARARQVTLQLPSSVPSSLSIYGIGTTTVKEGVPQPGTNGTRWVVTLADAYRDSIHLAIDVQVPHAALATAESATVGSVPAPDAAGLLLPIVQATDVAYQSGYVAVEGSPDLDVQITQHPRKVDIGELTDAAYTPGRRLLGAYGFVGPLPTVTATVHQRDAYALPAAIVQRATLTSVLSANGVSQSALDVTLLSKVAFVEVDLPTGATLWSAFVDDRPARPQRTGDRLLLDLQNRGIHSRVRLVYENTLPAWGFTGTAALPAPRLWLAAERTAARESVPVVDLTWTVTLPDGFSVIDTGGNLQRLEHRPAPVAAVRAAEWIYDRCGGIGLRRGILGRIVYTLGVASRRSRMVARRSGAYEYASGEPVLLQAHDDEMPEIALEEARQGPADWSTAHPARSVAPAAPSPVRSAGSLASAPALVGGVVMSGVADGTVSQRSGWQDDKGMRSLAIGLTGTGSTVTFRGLGDTPHVALQVFQNRRREAMALALALIVFLGGVLLTAKPARPRAVYLAVTIALSSLLPVLPPLTGWVVVLNGAFYGACALIPFYLAVAIVGRIGARVKQSARTVLLRQAATGLLALALTGVAAPNRALASPPTGAARQPVSVPADAVIVPYVPGQTAAAEQVLIPYDEFIALQRQALATDQVAPETDRPYAIAGAGFAGTLIDEGDVLLDGWMELDVFTADPVMVPLALSGGVLVAATLDGAPARLGSVMPRPHEMPAMPATSQQQQSEILISQQAAAHAAPIVQLYVHGQGRHRIALTIRAAITRRGGWRVVSARLPVGAANLLALTVPRAGTELRLDGVQDRAGFTTEEPDSLIETTLPADGRLQLQWRPRVSEGEIDRALTVASHAVLDVQEDNLRLLWQLTISFRRGEYSQFEVELPPHYRVERVTGNNVRGWQMVPAATPAPTRLRVELLKPARDSETVTLHLWQPDWVVLTADKTTELPAVRVPDAARETGLLTVRRSPLLSIRALDGQGIRRTDLQTDDALAPLGVSASESPLGVQLFQSYAFAAVPYSLTLAVSAPQPVIRARTQTILRMAERERRIECRFLLDIRERPLHRLRIDVPAELDITRVAVPGHFEWTTVDGPATRHLLIYLAEGAQGELPVVVAGRYGAIGTVESVALPVMRVADAVEQDGLIAVQSDPGFDARPLDLHDIEPVLLQRVQPWLSAAQLDVTRLALHNRQADYAGRVALVPIAPDVACDIITNVRVTDRAIEETVLLDFTVRESGIRQVSFRLPAYLEEASIRAPLLREKTMTALPETGQVQVELTLQDQVMDQLRVLIRGDRALTDGSFPVRLAQVETGSVRRRILAVESAGRDELETSGIVGLERLTRQQKDWALAARFLRGGQTEAYVAATGADAPALVLETRQRDTVETAGAGIGLAQATIVVDGDGAYRAEQVYHVDNRTEQFLTIRLPPDAELWTALVAGESVKPVVDPVLAAGQVRIPLVKTAAGDLDYAVVLTYAGRLPTVGLSRPTQFPVIETVNIAVESSLVELRLPTTHHWLQFDGTMRALQTAGDLQARQVAYQAQLAKRLVHTLKYGNPFERARAVSNLKNVKASLEIQESRSTYGVGDRLQVELANAEAVITSGDAEATRLAEAVDGDGLDNTTEILNAYGNQMNRYTRNVVLNNDGNWAAGVADSGANVTNPTAFNTAWFVANNLTGEGEPGSQPKGEAIDRIVISEAELAGRQQGAQDAHQGADKDQIGKHAEFWKSQYEELEQVPDDTPEPARARGGQKALMQRYQQALDGQAANRPDVTLPMQQDVGINGRLGSGGATVPTQAMPAEGILDDRDSVGPGQRTALGLVGLQVALPGVDTARWRVYRFTTPRGDAHITARAVRVGMIEAGKRVVTGLLAVLVALLLFRLLSGLAVANLNWRRYRLTFIAAGVLGMLLGIFPVLSGFALLAGLLLLACWRPAQRANAESSR